MSEQDELLADKILKLLNREDMKLGDLLSSLQELAETFPLALPAYAIAGLSLDLFPQGFRLALLAFLGHFPLRGTHPSPLIWAAEPLERFMLYEALVQKRALEGYAECKINALEARLVEEKRTRKLSSEDVEVALQPLLAQLETEERGRTLAEPVVLNLPEKTAGAALRGSHSAQLEALARHAFLRTRGCRGFEPDLLLPLPTELPTDASDLHALLPLRHWPLPLPADAAELRGQLVAGLCALSEPQEEVPSQATARSARHRGNAD